jgi:hypothetical protein
MSSAGDPAAADSVGLIDDDRCRDGCAIICVELALIRRRNLFIPARQASKSR